MQSYGQETRSSGKDLLPNMRMEYSPVAALRCLSTACSQLRRSNGRADRPSTNTNIRNQWLHIPYSATISLSGNQRRYMADTQWLHRRFPAHHLQDKSPKSAYHRACAVLLDVRQDGKRQMVTKIMQLIITTCAATRRLICIANPMGPMERRREERKWKRRRKKTKNIG